MQRFPVAPRKRLRGLLGAALGVALCAAGAAEHEADANADAPPPRPEHEIRPLPADTFEPSEEISEDYPVPFPVDI